MSLELGLKAIDEATELGVEWVSFTGGEPFLELELLMHLIKSASEKDLKTEVVTNGYWANTSKKAEQILSSLLELGLDVLNLASEQIHH